MLNSEKLRSPSRGWPSLSLLALALVFLFAPQRAFAMGETETASGTTVLPKPFVRESGNRILPDFVFQELLSDGSLKEWGFVDLRGRPIVAVSWATWCGVCAKDLPHLEALEAKLSKKAKGSASAVLVAALSIDDLAPKKVAADLAKRGIRGLRHFFDTDKMFFLTTSGVGVPSAIIADSQGRIVARAQGSVNWQDPVLLAFIESLAK